MKIAVTVRGETLDDEIDPRFGRAQNFLIYDMDSGESTIMKNEQNLGAVRGAGIQSAEMIIRQGAEILFTGHCGPNAFRTLSAANISVVTGVEGTARQAIDNYKAGKYKISTSSDVEGHW